jgi:hypothetical protein
MLILYYGQLFIACGILTLLINYLIPSSYSEINSNSNLANIYQNKESKKLDSNYNDNSENSLHSRFNFDPNYNFSQSNDSINLINDQKDTNLINDQKITNKQLFKKDTGNDTREYIRNLLYPSVIVNDLYGKVEDSNDYHGGQDDESSSSPSTSKSVSPQQPSIDTHYVQVFDKNGNFIKSWGESGKGEGKLLHPHGIAVDSKGYVYVTDELKSKVLKFDSDGNFVTSWGENGNAINQFSKRIEDIDVDSNDNVYVVDYGKTSKILKFDSDGNFIASLGSKGKGIGEFKRPWGVNVDTEGNIYVSEKLNYRVSKYNSNGEFVTMWGTNGTNDGNFKHLHAVVVDAKGNVYATDEDKGNVQKFTSDGQFITKWGSWGKGEGQMREVHGIATDSEGNVYIVDTRNARIQKFTSDGEFISSWGKNGLGDGKFLMIHDLDIDSNDNIYTIDQRGGHPTKNNAEKFLTLDYKDRD